MKKILLFAVVSVLIVSVSVTSISAQSQYEIPSWVKGVAGFWAEGKISDDEFGEGLSFLIDSEIIKVPLIQELQNQINQGVINIPIKEVTATKTTLTDSDRAQSFVVTFSSGVTFTSPEIFYTFSRFEHISTTTNDDTLDVSKGFEATPAFILSSLPSEDKAIIYKMINTFINAGNTATPFDVKIDIVSGAGNIITTFSYAKCTVADFSVFLQQDREVYSFSEKEGSEIRDIILFKCSGFRLV